MSEGRTAIHTFSLVCFEKINAQLIERETKLVQMLWKTSVCVVVNCDKLASKRVIFNQILWYQNSYSIPGIFKSTVQIEWTYWSRQWTQQRDSDLFACSLNGTVEFVIDEHSSRIACIVNMELTCVDTNFTIRQFLPCTAILRRITNQQFVYRNCDICVIGVQRLVLNRWMPEGCCVCEKNYLNMKI